MEVDGRTAMSRYCKAQAQLNKIDREKSEERRSLTERIKTYRSVLQDDMEARNITCLEVFPEGCSDPLYVRLKPITSFPTINHDLVMEVLKQADHTRLMGSAEKNGHDLPRTLAHVFNVEFKEKHTKVSEKSSISISTTKERGFTRESQATASNEMRQMANDLVKAKEDVNNMRAQQTIEKKPVVEEQKEIENVVKETLRKTDPLNMMTRVHMMQDGGEWIYFLRCKEKQVASTLGIRKLVPMVEMAAAQVLEALGMSREFTGTRLNIKFWELFSVQLEEQIKLHEQKTKKISRLSLDRGAPRSKNTTKSTE